MKFDPICNCATWIQSTWENQFSNMGECVGPKSAITREERLDTEGDERKPNGCTDAPSTFKLPTSQS